MESFNKRYADAKKWLSAKLNEDISSTDMLYDVEKYFYNNGLEPDYILQILTELGYN